ncbi:uncharacterized protein LOC136085931 [Hydra vulgaris]|uniref:uncharacterized protein LOC136085931 n=1 Tax=Hydra vulgaris TaxID=6087 RepID=UPI0032EA5E1D
MIIFSLLKLSFIDIISGAGPTYTYQHKTLSNSSYIDHITALKESSLLFINTSVIPPSAFNFSDHLPIATNIVVTHTNLSTVINSIIHKYNYIPKYAWNNEKFINIYNHNLCVAFNYYTFNEEEIEQELKQTCEKIQNAALLAVKQCFKQQICKYSKSWWTTDLKKCKENLSFNYKQWQKSNYNKTQECIEYKRYIFSRKNFRKAVKAAHNKKIHEKTINIENLRTTNPQRFWDNIRKIKTKATTQLFTINKSQNIKDIVQEFRQHFQTLLNTPLILNNNHNPSQIPPLSKEPNSLIITSADIISCISRLNSNKPPDSYGLSAEHLKNSHNNNLLLWLAKFYNSILSNGKVPNDLSTSTIIPLVKPYKKSLNNPDNYRGISFFPIFTKLLDLDANKAFDTCNWDLLFEKLYIQKILPLSVVRTTSSLYHSGSANISYQGVTSNQFSLSQGVRQGSILSPHLYNIYTESILNEIVSECKVGSTINGIYTGVIAYADDLNTEKTEFLISGKSYIPNNVVKINGVSIYLQNKLKHLGFQWDNNISKNKIATLRKKNLNERITQFQSVAKALIDSGIRYCQPSTIVHLYNTLTVPKLIYGLELCKYDTNFLSKIDAVGRAVLKSFFLYFEVQ